MDGWKDSETVYRAIRIPTIASEETTMQATFHNPITMRVLHFISGYQKRSETTRHQDKDKAGKTRQQYPRREQGFRLLCRGACITRQALMILT